VSGKTSVSRRRRAVYGALVLASVFAAMLIGARFAYSREPLYGGLIWNLFLAWIPFVLAIVIYDRHRSGMRVAALLPLGALWLLFLPNAPYIVTDFRHLEQSPRVPLWFDVVVIAAPAWTGMLLGLLSVYLVQVVVRNAVGHRASWAVALSALGLASFGIYLGRVLRWNSWDVLVDPTLLTQLLFHLESARAVAMTVLLTGFLVVSYVVVYALAPLAALVDEQR
jgi:uncharacterized membrane protein